LTPQLPGSRLARRKALGAELRRLRELSGVSGRDIAKALGLNQSAVSRVEKGERPLSLPDLRRWAALIGAEGEALERLEWRAEQALTGGVPLADLLASGDDALQDDIQKRLEQPSRFIASFCPSYVTGLLQTPEYARRIYSLIREPELVAPAVRARLNRQQILYDQARRLEFIICEAALHWRTGEPGFLVPQLERLATIALLPNITLQVIPSAADMRTIPLGEFTLYEEREDGPIVALEHVHGNDELMKPDEIQPYREELVLLRQSALSEEDSLAFIRNLADHLSDN
jgi:transcriptional regulator with XRE-family HTH domain